MAIPDYQSIMLPLLRFASDGEQHTTRESIEHLAAEFSLSEDERKELLPSGRQATFDNRVGWASTYLRKAGLLGSDRRGYFHISPRGQEVLSTNPSQLDAAFLEQFPEFLAFRQLRHENREPTAAGGQADEGTPEESLESSFQKLKDELSTELLDTIKSNSPQFFERLVVDLLVKMGYGGSRKEAGQAIGKSGDEGIDGIIKEDRLGLDIIYIQAKKWEGTVSRPEIHKFAGALQGQRARKGIFITTSTFSREAQEYAQAIDTKIILIDGQRLADLMIEHDVGVAPIASYDIKRIDTDYFSED